METLVLINFKRTLGGGGGRILKKNQKIIDFMLRTRTQHRPYTIFFHYNYLTDYQKLYSLSFSFLISSGTLQPTVST